MNSFRLPNRELVRTVFSKLKMTFIHHALVKIILFWSAQEKFGAFHLESIISVKKDTITNRELVQDSSAVIGLFSVLRI